MAATLARAPATRTRRPTLEQHFRSALDVSMWRAQRALLALLAEWEEELLAPLREVSPALVEDLRARIVDDISAQQSVRDVTRSLLDAVAGWGQTLRPSLRTAGAPAVKSLTARIQSILLILEQQFEAASEIYRDGGVMPPFGRQAVRSDGLTFQEG